MYAGYVKIRNQLEAYRWGFVAWNDDTERFEMVRNFDTQPTMFVGPQSHPFRWTEQGREYIYFCHPFPLTRVPADAASFLDPEKYQGFTCLKQGTRPEDRQLDRRADGGLNFGWKTNTPPLTHDQQSDFIEAGLLKPEERRFVLQDAATGRSVQVQGGSVYWNDFRKRWVMIAVEIYGESSLLGEIWYAEADAPTGPWRYGRKVVTHVNYSFYNPKHHPFFDGDGGRIIYFEGTYTKEFSGNPVATPRYDYNQIMYRLDLGSPRLSLPVAIYRQPEENGTASYVTRAPQRELAFFALDRPGPDCVAVVASGQALQVEQKAERAREAVFYALPVDIETPPATTTALYEFIHQETGARVYGTQRSWTASGYHRQEKPICRVWKAN
jgi:hypothetical protein